MGMTGRERDRINLAELREELQAHENDDLYRITLGVPLVRTLIDAVEAAHDPDRWDEFLAICRDRFDFGSRRDRPGA